MNELETFRQEVADWLQANRPPTPDFLLPESFMEVGTDPQFHYLRDWQRKVYQAGYLGMTWPTAYGGGGRPQAFQDIATAEMARLKVPFFPNTIGLFWAGPLILAIGTEEQKRRFIPGILSGDDIWCQGFSEPDQGSDLANAQTRAVRDGDDYVINGAKIWTSLGSHAKYMILLARTDPQPAPGRPKAADAPSGGRAPQSGDLGGSRSKRYAGLSYFLIPMQVPGISTTPIRKLTGEFGFTQTFFDNARVPASCLMGKEGEGWAIAMKTLTFERGASGGQAGGLTRMALGIGDVIELARRSRRNGRPAIDDPFIRDQLVRFQIEAQGDRLCNERGRFPALCSERPDAIPLSNKLRLSEHNRRLYQFALTLQGANGARWVGDAHAVDGGLWPRSYLNAFASTIGGGPSQIQANIVGERVLGLPKD
ncbi:MAG: acyl-CoA dehydrogenase [Burkholderiales bacterium RIFCSPHIGHO2_12_FULL_69_20]|nr:MAG: acyl-CoA dehydrogenase [Burkholderiales bacterium RIFCSPHIGHO2_12_FULL_69_20]